MASKRGKSILAGLLCFPASFVVLWWNEGRAVERETSLEEVQEKTVTVASGSVSAANDGKPVHTTGDSATSETLADPVFGVSLQAIKLRREVEMYQWEEDDDDKRVSYRKRWSSSAIDSSDFKEPATHPNPKEWKVKAETWQVQEVRVGAFRLSKNLIDRLGGWVTLDPPQQPPAGFQRSGSYLTTSADSGNPQVGDLRVELQAIKSGPVSVVAKQSGSQLEDVQTRAGSPVGLIYSGTLTAPEVFERAFLENTIMTWILRLVGVVMMLIGLLTLFTPITYAMNYVPFFGGLVNAGILLFSLLTALSLSLLTIAIAWLFYRPLLGGALLAGAIGLIVLLKVVAKSRQPQPAV
ncbi:MAG TPA: TMEM43 family protein [Planctomycetota bacterium]|nr:TMEM43 family protein [Planctomycetota bacterium]